MVRLTGEACESFVKKLVEEGRLPEELKGIESCTEKRCRSFIERLCEAIVRGRDAEYFKDLTEWGENLTFSCILLTLDDYLRAAVHALSLAPKIAATDYGTSRQRDLAQVWTDAIRGFLGEIAFVKWLKERFEIEAELEFRVGSLEEFLATDIVKLRRPGEDWRKPKLRISIKTTKLQGIWLDIPYAQIEHSDVFVLVRIGVTRSHFLAFLKEISVIRDKIFSLAENLNIKFDKDSIWESVPNFTKIPAFIAGYFCKSDWGEGVEDRRSILVADGELKRTRSGACRIVLNRFAGWWNPKDPGYKKRLVELLRNKYRGVSADSEKLTVEFESIGEPSETLHFLVSSGVLRRRREDWERVVVSM